MTGAPTPSIVFVSGNWSVADAIAEQRPSPLLGGRLRDPAGTAR